MSKDLYKALLQSRDKIIYLQAGQLMFQVSERENYENGKWL